MDGVTELVDVNDPNKNADDTNDLAKQLSKLIDLDGKRSLLFLFGGIHDGLLDLTDLRVHAGLGLSNEFVSSITYNDTGRGTVGDDGTGKEHVDLIRDTAVLGANEIALLVHQRRSTGNTFRMVLASPVKALSSARRVVVFS